MSTVLETTTLLAQVGLGRVQGGWEYVWAAYGIAWASLSLYSLSLWTRRPSRAPRDAKE
jgi:hypothetical protein